MNAFRAGAAGLCFLFAPQLCAQDPVLNEQLGALVDTNITGATRQGGVGSNVAYDALFPREDFQGWGFDPTALGFHRINGARVVLADLDSSTAEMVEIWVYPEDATNPGNPDFTNPAGGFVFPVFGGGNPGELQSFRLDLTFPTPVLVPDTGDVYFEIFLDGTDAPETYVATIQGDVIPGRDYDIGNGLTAETGHGLGDGGYTLLFDFDITQAFFQESQVHITPLCEDLSGFALAAATSQLSLPSPNGVYTASFFSALQPCDTMDRQGNPRQDDLAWVWNDGRTVGGETVVVLMQPDGFAAAPLGLDLFVPGSTGGLCLNIASGVPLVEIGQAMTDVDGRASNVLSIPASARGTLAGQAYTLQAFSLDFVGARVLASGCGQNQWF